jgi:hypothetical protein
LIKYLIKYLGNNVKRLIFEVLKTKDMKTLSQLRKEAKAAPKYVLKMDGLELYYADRQPLSGFNVTENLNEAMLFSVCFDNEQIKVGAINAVAKYHINNADVKFEVKYL